jgi:hypothetical protein
MTILGGTGSPQISISGGLTPVSTPVIYNVLLTLAATEYSLSIPSGTKRLTVRNRNGHVTRLAYTAGGTTSAWLTIDPGADYSEVDLVVTSLTVYLQAPSAAGTTVEVTVWS